MRKLIFVAALAALLPTAVFSAQADVATLKAYAVQSLARCPDQKVTLERADKAGPLGFVDASDRFLIVGSRGNLLMPPSRTLLDALNLQNGVRRGNPKAKSQIIELSDFECPSCRRAHIKLEPLIEKNLSKVDYVRLDL